MEKQKKVLILAGQGVHCKVVEAAKELGIYTIVADYLVDSPAKKIADESSMVSILDTEAVINLAREKQVDGVMNFCNDPVCKVLQTVNETLGLPNIGTKEQVYALTNKNAFKKLCISCGVDVIPEYSEEDIENGKIQFPVLVKPVDSRGSRGSQVCKNRDELLCAIPAAKEESSDGSIIIEKYLEGCQDLTITYMVKDGHPYLISVGDRYQGSKECGLTRQIRGTIQPSRYIDMYIKNVNDRVIAMIKKLGIQNAPVFMQGFVDGDTVRMYDPGIRFPGNEYERIFTRATGLNPMKSMVKYFVDGVLDDYDGKYEGSYDLNGLCAIQYMINIGAGTVDVFEGLDEISKHPNVVDVQQKIFVGDTVKFTGNINHRAGEISVLCERTPEKIREMIQFIQSKLVICDKEGKDMIISPFDTPTIYKNYGGAGQ